jgi:hypothetical protein
MSARSQIVGTIVEAIHKKKLHTSPVHEGPKLTTFNVSTSAFFPSGDKYGLAEGWADPVAVVTISDSGTIDVETQTLWDPEDQKLVSRVRKIVESVVTR